MEIPEGWKLTSLDSLADNAASIRYGVVQIGANTPNGVPIVPIKYINKISTSALHLAANEIERKYTNSRVQPGDVLISVKGTIGEVGIVPSDFFGNIAREIARIRPGKGIDNNFLAFQLRAEHTQRRMHRLIVGTTRLEFSIKELKKFLVPVPSLKEQKRIAEILGTWDRAIVVTEALIAKSEAQKKALMQQLLTGKRRLPGFEDDWKEVRLGDVAEMTSGNAFKSSDISEEGDYRLIRMNDLKVGVLKNSDPRFVADHALDGLERFILHPGDFVFGMTGSLSNYAWIPPDLANTLYLNQRVGRLSAKNKNSSRFLQQLYLSTSVQNNILRMAAGAAQLNISLRDLRSFIISVPSFDEQKAIARIIDISADEVNVLQTKLQTLKTEKAALMQQLLTGKRRVKLTEVA